MFTEQTEHPELNIRDYFEIVWKRRLLVFAVFTVFAVSTIVVIAAWKPEFSATAEVVIEKSQPIIGAEAGYNPAIPGVTETQLRLLKTEDFAQKVVEQLIRKAPIQTQSAASDKGDPYAGEPLHFLISNVRTVTNFFRDARLSLFGGAAPEEEAAKGTTSDGVKPRFNKWQVLNSLEVKIVPNTDIIQIIATSPDATEAALIANTTAETFIRDRIERRLNSVQQAIRWLEGQLKEEQSQLDGARIELYNFMQQYGILDIDEHRSTKLDEELTAMKEKVRSAREKTNALKFKLDQITKLSKSPELIDTIPEALNNEILAKLRTQEVTLEQESIKLSATYGSNHPNIMLIQRQLDNIRKSKREEVEKIINSIRFQYETALSEEKSLTQASDKLEKSLEDLKKKTIRYFTLKREVESGEKIYDVLLNRFKETTLAEEMSKSTNASVIQHAYVPLMPSKPNVPRVLAVGLFLGLAAGVGLAFLLEHLDNTFTKPDQVEHYLGLTFLGAVPLLTLPQDPSLNGNRTLVARVEPKSSGAEAYRALRTSILLSSADYQPQALLVTSPGKGEGKSSTAANLATVMAQAGNRVLLIDCDLRKPTLHKIFDLDRDLGLSRLLVSRELDPAAFIQQSGENGLDVLTCGPIPPNPSELLGSKKMAELIEMLRNQYDRIILDSPPLLAATDAAVLTPFIDGTVLVVRAGETRREAAQRTVRILADLNARITGIVLNQLEVRKNGYYYYDYYYYGHYYGEEEKQEHRRGKRKSIAGRQ